MVLAAFLHDDKSGVSGNGEAMDANDSISPPATDAPALPDGRLPAFEPHTLRPFVLGEIHARPFRPVATPRIVLHYAFTCDAEQARADRLWLAERCASQGGPSPDEGMRSHAFAFGAGLLRWEQHAEFITYTWDGPAAAMAPFGGVPGSHPFGSGFRAPGPLLSAVRLDLLPSGADDLQVVERHFDPASLSAFQADGEAAIAATDFRQDGDGMTRILVLNRSMNENQAGAFVQRLLEIETYRTLALLGLPVAIRLAPEIGRIERDLVEITAHIQDTSGLEPNRALLEKLSSLAADLEAGAAASAYRFGASRAYYEIVKARLQAIAESPLPGHMGMSAFLTRRLAPAMRTCQAMEDRQANLSRKLARATTLLRTRVDVDLEQQNRNLLESMNRRARLQLRLQQTVEGLSVAAISYYIVGLIGYLAKAAKDAGLPMLEPAVATGVSVPVVLLVIWHTIRRIRAHHAEGDDGH
ncbi:Hypothetical transmembrane protein [Polymorphum gilvum SL003B-26A1]|uniref:Hypothetical transmembrane protein n=1 Tax=Polymorphum gilvum (strain LMG 25793 / CGMCC 1.9160 / SL003B-26A1) TaxID=991905 RepID=F2J067_POLGS|nr:Hypothetical transmembrane protein [Polymorphum gilvum SL003B-26A1]